MYYNHHAQLKFSKYPLRYSTAFKSTIILEKAMLKKQKILGKSKRALNKIPIVYFRRLVGSLGTNIFLNMNLFNFHKFS